MKKILIVDDSESIKKFWRAILKSEDYFIVGEASNGKEAYLLSKKINPDLVIMDVNMPVMDGIESAKKILDFFSEIKIILVSTVDQKLSVLKAIQFGVKNYIPKPINKDNAINIINGVLNIDNIKNSRVEECDMEVDIW